MSDGKLAVKYEFKKGGRLGPGPDDLKEFTIIDRVIAGPAGASSTKPTLGRLRTCWRALVSMTAAIRPLHRV